MEKKCKRIVLVNLKIGEHKINNLLNKMLNYHLR
jgi:hypothetical protein